MNIFVTIAQQRQLFSLWAEKFSIYKKMDRNNETRALLSDGWLIDASEICLAS